MSGQTDDDSEVSPRIFSRLQNSQGPGTFRGCSKILTLGKATLCDSLPVASIPGSSKGLIFDSSLSIFLIYTENLFKDRLLHWVIFWENLIVF